MVRRSIRTSLCKKNSTVSQNVHKHCSTQLNDMGRHCGNTSNIVQKVSYRKGIVDVIQPGQRNNSQATTTSTHRISKKKYQQKLRRQRNITNNQCSVSSESSLQQVEVEHGKHTLSESTSVEVVSPRNAKIAIPRTSNADHETQEFNKSNMTVVFEDVQLNTEDKNHSDYDELSYDRIDIREVQAAESSNISRNNHSDCIIC